MKEKSLSGELREMAMVDIRTVDTKDLVDLETVKINPDLPVKDRVTDYMTELSESCIYLVPGICLISYQKKKIRRND